MRIIIPALVVAVFLAVFACSESPSSSSANVSSSSEFTPSSSSTLSSASGRACKYSDEPFGLICTEMPSDMPNLQKHKVECERGGGTWANACPSGEKAACIDDSDEELKDALIKFYSDDFACSDFSLKNANGSEDVVSKGGACDLGDLGPVSMCEEYPEFSTVFVKILCTREEAPFVSKCPSSADLICYYPEEKAILYYYEEIASSRTCEDFGFEDL